MRVDVKTLKLKRVMFTRLILLPPLCSLTHLELVVPTARNLENFLDPLLPACNRLKALSLRASDHGRTESTAAPDQSLFFLDVFPQFGGQTLTFLHTDESIVINYPSLLSRFNAITALVYDVDTKAGLDALRTTVLSKPLALTDFAIRRREFPLSWDAHSGVLNTPAMMRLKRWCTLGYYRHQSMTTSRWDNKSSADETHFRQECSSRGIKVMSDQQVSLLNPISWCGLELTKVRPVHSVEQLLGIGYSEYRFRTSERIAIDLGLWGLRCRLGA